jgi:hypothetical protein
VGPSIGDDQLRAAFGHFGELELVEIFYHPQSRTSLQVGCVMFRDADAAANARIAAANKMLYVSGRFLPDLKLRDDPYGDLARQAYFSCVQPTQPTPQPQQPQQRTMSAMERLQQQMRMGMAGRPGAQPLPVGGGARPGAAQLGVAGFGGATAAAAGGGAPQLFISGFSPNTPVAALRAAFGRFGTVEHVGVQQHPVTGQPLAIATVIFAHPAEATAAIGAGRSGASTLQQELGKTLHVIADRDGAIVRRALQQLGGAPPPPPAAAGRAGGGAAAAAAAAAVEHERPREWGRIGAGKLAWGSKQVVEAPVEAAAAASSSAAGAASSREVTTLRDRYEKEQREGKPKTKRSTEADERAAAREVAYAPTDRALDAFVHGGATWQHVHGASGKRSVPRWHACFKRVEIERELQMFADFKIGDDAGAFRRRVHRRHAARQPLTLFRQRQPLRCRQRWLGDDEVETVDADPAALGAARMADHYWWKAPTPKGSADAAEPATPLGDDAFEGWEELFDEALGGAAAGEGSGAGEAALPAAEVGA